MRINSYNEWHRTIGRNKVWNLGNGATTKGSYFRKAQRRSASVTQDQSFRRDSIFDYLTDISARRICFYPPRSADLMISLRLRPSVRNAPVKQRYSATVFIEPCSLFIEVTSLTLIRWEYYTATVQICQENFFKNFTFLLRSQMLLYV